MLIIAVRSSPGIIGRLPFLGFATQDWYRLARETDRHFCLSVAFWAPLSRLYYCGRLQGSRFKVCECVCECAVPWYMKAKWFTRVVRKGSC